MNNLSLKFNIELKSGRSGQLIHSTRTSALIVSKRIQHHGQEYCQVKLRLKTETEYLILATCQATISKVENVRSV